MEIELGKWYVVHVTARGSVAFIMKKAQLTAVDFTTIDSNGIFSFLDEQANLVRVPQSWITYVSDWTEPVDPEIPEG